MKAILIVFGLFLLLIALAAALYVVCILFLDKDSLLDDIDIRDYDDK